VKGLLVAAAIVILPSAMANAADIAARPYTKAPLAELAYNWSGFYVGATIGAGWSTVDPTFSDPRNVAWDNCGPCYGSGFATQTIDQKATGVLGGFHGGYNWQVSPNWLLGLEGDFTGSDLKHTTNAPLIGFASGTLAPFNVANSNLNFQTNINWLASIRGRLGYVKSNWLIYATGGVAFANINFSGAATCGDGGPMCGPLQGLASFSTTRTGWTVGAGTEWQIPNTAWRARAEYLFYEFDTTNAASVGFTAGGVSASCVLGDPCNGTMSVGKIDIQTVRVGLSYAFR
jgi:outer membrane immunogenic protein